MKVTFKKRRFYKHKLREPGDVVDMDKKDARAFLRVNAVVETIKQLPEKKEEPFTRSTTFARSVTPSSISEFSDEDSTEDSNELESLVEEFDGGASAVADSKGIEEFGDLTYRDLQERCKEKGLSAAGAKTELIERLRTQGE